MQKPGSSKVDTSSLIDLKAELFRKQEEFKAQKLQSQNTGFIKGKSSGSTKKPSLFSKKNVGVSQRAEKDYEEKVEEENVFERSRKALENKAKLYEQIASSSSISEEDGSKLYLVDFQKKSIDDFEERIEKERREKEEIERKEMEEEQRQLAEPVPPPDTEEEEWVDYVDAFGRSRRCLRKDLPDVQKQNETLQEKKRKVDEKFQRGYKEFQQLRDKSEDIPHLMSDDMKREMDRQKWEKEEIEKMEEEKRGPIHYSDVQHNEIRTHGVGYYKFDKEENVRQEQMEQLKKLRKETKDERSKSARIKEKRKAALAARLAKVKQRKREKLGLPELEEDNGSSEEEIEEQAKKEPEPLTRDDSWRATVHSTRDWDKGKQLTLERSEEVWLEKQRAEREEEFAPPSFYYDTGSYSKHNIKKDSNIKENNPKDKTLIGKRKEETEVKEVIEKQLSKIRNSSDVECSKTEESEKDLVITHKINNEEKETVVDSVKTNDLQQGVVDPCNNMQSSLLNPLHTTNIPPPNFNVPPPNYMTPPPNYTAPPPNFMAPPNYTAPPTNYTLPPPNYTAPPPSCNVLPQTVHFPASNIPPPGHIQPFVASSLSVPSGSAPQVCNVSVKGNPVPSFETNLSATTSFENSNQGGQYIKTQAEEKVRKKFVPKIDIIDTRLMGGEGD